MPVGYLEATSDGYRFHGRPVECVKVHPDFRFNTAVHPWDAARLRELGPDIERVLRRPLPSSDVGYHVKSAIRSGSTTVVVADLYLLAPPAQGSEDSIHNL